MKKVKIIAVILVIFTILSCVLVTYADNTVKGISDNIIRLHVIAESDSEEDQAIKLKVRDKLLEYMQEELNKTENSFTRDDSEKIIKSKLPVLEQIAKDILKENGKEEIAKAEFGNFPFPTKKYENIELPAGTYNALRITLGKGEGQNWWCVMFPPLCFAGATGGELSDESQKALEETLPEDQYNIITSTDEEEDIPIRIKFKLVDFIEDSKNSIQKFFASIFG